MKKVLCSLIVLAILVGMFVCLGAQAFADGESPKDLAIVAVADDALTADHISRIKEDMKDSHDVLVIDVNGLDPDQPADGYSYVYAPTDPMQSPSGYEYIWPGKAPVSRTVTDNNGQECTVAVLAIGPEDTADGINASIQSYKQEGVTSFVIAIAPEGAAVQAAVDSAADKVLTCGESGVSSDKLVKVGGDSASPVSVVTVDEFAAANASNMPMPEVASVGAGPEIDTMLPDLSLITDPPSAPEAGPTTCEILYKGGDGSEGSMPDDHAFQVGGTLTFPQNTNYTKEGSKFAGWLVNETGLTYQPGDQLVVESTINVTAQWQVMAVPYIVTYKAEGQTDIVDTVLRENADGYVLKGSDIFAAPEGQSFVGWVDASGYPWPENSACPLSSDLTFTAQWQPAAPAAFTVTYTAGDGNGTAYVVSDVTADSQLTMIEMPADFAKEGYHFTGWNMNGTHYDVGAPFTASEETLITAEWTVDEVEAAPATATITYAPGEGGGEQYVVTVDLSTLSTDEYGKYLYQVQDCTFTAPEGKQFAGWQESNSQQVIQPISDGVVEQIPLTAGDNVVLTATWAQPVAADPESDSEDDTDDSSETVTSFTVTYSDPLTGGTYAAEPVAPGSVITLLTPEQCGFATPAGKTFGTWYDEAGTGTNVTGSYTVPATLLNGAAGLTFQATWNDVISYTVTYKAGEAASNASNADQVVSGLPAGDYTLNNCIFIAPEGKTFDYWQIGDQTFAAGAVISLSGNVDVTAVWKVAPVENQTAITQNGDTITWTRGGTDRPSVTFDNANIATVSIDGRLLTENSEMHVEGNSFSLEPNYLNTLEQKEYNLTVTFANDANGGTFNPYVMTVSVTVPPAVTPAPSPDNRTIKQDWNRAVDWAYTFSAAPNKVEIYYGKDQNGNEIYQEAKDGSDYTISGNTLTLKPAMVNGNWGGQWGNATYNFRVTLADTSTYMLQLQLTGTAPAATAAPTNTPVPTNAAGVPVTGDETPITLYIVILVVLIIALAGVLIFVMKRKSSSGGGRH